MPAKTADLIDLPTVKACRQLVLQELRKCGHQGFVQCDYCDRVLAEYEAAILAAAVAP